MNPLNDLMTAATADPPEDAFLPADLLAAGRRRVLRRRVVGGIAAAAVVGVGVAGALTFDPGRPTGTREPEPVQHVKQEGPVLTAGDATPARAGRDYRELMTTAVADIDAKTGLSVRALLPFSSVLLADGQPYQDVKRWGVRDANGDVGWLPKVPGDQPHRFLGQTQSHGWVFEGNATPDIVTLWSYTQTTSSWTRLDIDLRGIGPDRQTYLNLGFEVGADRLWVVAASATGSEDRLWSRPLADGGTWELIDESVRDFSVSDWAQIYITGHDDDSVVWAKLAGAEPKRILDLPSDEKCVPNDVEAGSNLTTVSLVCDTDDGSYERTLVIGLDGRLLVTIRTPDASPVSVGGDLVSFGSDDGSLYALDVRNLKLFNVSGGIQATGCCPSDGRRLVWLNLLEGTKQYVVSSFD